MLHRKERLIEGQFINKSVFHLDQVLKKLAQGKFNHIPFRSSAITKLLKNSLVGNNHTKILICVNPSESSFDTTINSMTFALKTASFSKRKSLINTIMSKSKDPEVEAYIQTLMKRITELENEVIDLRQQMKDREYTTYNSTVKKEKEDLRRSAENTASCVAQNKNSNELECSLSSFCESGFKNMSKKEGTVLFADSDPSLQQSLRKKLHQKAQSYQPPSVPEKDFSEECLADVDFAGNKISNQYYEVSESDRRQLDMIQLQSSMQQEDKEKEQNDEIDKFNLVLKDTGCTLEVKESYNSNSRPVTKKDLENFNVFLDSYPNYKYCSMDEECEPTPRQPLSMRVGNDKPVTCSLEVVEKKTFYVNYNRNKENISFEIEDANFDTPDLFSKRKPKEAHQKESLVPALSAICRQIPNLKLNSISTQTELVLKEKNSNLPPASQKQEECKSERTRKRSNEASQGKSGQKADGEYDRRKGLAKKFSNISSQLRSIYQRRPLDSDRVLLENKQRSKSKPQQ